jgi:hypothetical protein
MQVFIIGIQVFIIDIIHTPVCILSYYIQYWTLTKESVSWEGEDSSCGCDENGFILSTGLFS